MCVKISGGATIGGCRPPTGERATTAATTVHATDAESVFWMIIVLIRQDGNGNI